MTIIIALNSSLSCHRSQGSDKPGIFKPPPHRDPDPRGKSVSCHRADDDAVTEKILKDSVGLPPAINQNKIRLAQDKPEPVTFQLPVKVFPASRHEPFCPP